MTGHTAEHYSAIRESNVLIRAVTRMSLKEIVPAGRNQSKGKVYDSAYLKYLNMKTHWDREIGGYQVLRGRENRKALPNGYGVSAMK